MKSKWHLIISVLKSAIRILSCVYLIVTGSVLAFAVGFLIAEVLGILEEIKDERG